MKKKRPQQFTQKRMKKEGMWWEGKKSPSCGGETTEKKGGVVRKRTWTSMKKKKGGGKIKRNQPVVVVAKEVGVMPKSKRQKKGKEIDLALKKKKERHLKKGWRKERKEGKVAERASLDRDRRSKKIRHQKCSRNSQGKRPDI